MGTILENVLVVVTVVIMVLALGVVTRRLLGVRVGLTRTSIAVVLSLLLAQQLVDALPVPAEDDPVTTWLFFCATICGASLLAMIIIVLAEVIVPDGSLPGPVELWRGWRSRLARTRRYSAIVRIAMRHGLGRFLRGQRHTGLASAPARRELARSVRRALDEGGVTFVKLGQQLSARRDLVPAEFVSELAQLQDHAAPVPWPEVEQVLARELGRPVHEVFASIEPVALAAASVAQVHAATLPSGEQVVVKVQRPGIAQVVERDLDILLRLAGVLEGRTEWARSIGLRNLALGFGDALREELDFTIERDNLRAMSAALESSSTRGVHVPAAYPALCTARVLVMERLGGVPLTDAQPLLATFGDDRRHDVATALLGTVLDQVVSYGMFHVDLHPGNVMVGADGSLGLLDLGSVGRLDGTTRAAIGHLMASIARGDSLAASDALLDLVERPEEIDERELERALGVLIIRFAAPGAGTGAAAFSALFRLVTSHRLGVPAQVAAVFRTFATLEGTLAAIDPGFDVVAEARRIGTRRATESLTPARLREIGESELAALLPVLRRLPRRVDRIADAVEHGRLSVRVRFLADARDRQVITELVQQVLLTLLGAAAGVMAVMLLANDEGPEVTESITLFALLGYSLLIISVVLVLRVLIVVFRREPR